MRAKDPSFIHSPRFDHKYSLFKQMVLAHQLIHLLKVLICHNASDLVERDINRDLVALHLDDLHRGIYDLYTLDTILL